MSEELRVVLPHLTNKTLTVRNREVWVNDEGLTDPLTPEEYQRLTGIGYPCWKTFQFPSAPLDTDALVALSPAELARITAAGFRLVPLQMDDVLPTFEDIQQKGDFEDEDDQEWLELGEAWLDMGSAERVETVQELEADPAGLGPVLTYLFDFEAHHLNHPAVLEAVDLAISRTIPKQTAEQINERIVQKSAEGKVKTKNPPHKKVLGK